MTEILLAEELGSKLVQLYPHLVLGYELKHDILTAKGVTSPFHDVIGETSADQISIVMRS